MSDPARIAARVELSPTDKDFARGLLLEIIEGLKGVGEGELLAFTTSEDVAEDLERWARFTGNAVIASTREAAGTRYVVRYGAPPLDPEGVRPIGSRLWLYTNLDCNLACDYCCVRSSPRTPRAELGLELVKRICAEAEDAGVREIFLTGGEPFLLPDIAEIVAAAAAAAPTTVLTNAMLFAGKRGDALSTMSRERVTLQISVDSAEPAAHDAHRGAGSWEKAWRGVRLAREAGFRVRLAATVEDLAAEEAFRAFLDREGIAAEDRVIRRVALRGEADAGIALSRADLVPEVTITAAGVFFHPVGAVDEDLFVTGQVLPLRGAIEAVRVAYEEERKFATALASVFHCA